MSIPASDLEMVVTCEWLERFSESLAQIRQMPDSVFDSPQHRQLMVNAYQSTVEELRAQALAYLLQESRRTR